jgi:hypothetical protein
MTAPTPPTAGGLEGMADKLGGSDILGKITELFSEADPKLDRLKESILGDLESLKQSPELESLAINMWKSAEEGLRKDLSELNVPNAQIETLVAEAKTKWITEIGPEQMRTILESPEKIALDKYVSELENLPVLTGIMASAKPKKNWEVWLSKITDKIPGLSTIIGPILALLGIKGEKAEKIKAVLAKGKGEKPEKPAEEPAEEPEVAKKGEEGKIELTNDQQAAIKPLQDAGFEMDLTKVKEDIAYLKGQNVDIEALAKESAEKNSKLNEVAYAMTNHLGNKKVKFRLMDAYIFDKDQLEPGQISEVVKNIEKIKKDPVKARTFLDNAHKIKKGDDNNKVATVLEIEKLRATA